MNQLLPRIAFLGCATILCSPNLSAQFGNPPPSGPDVAIHEVIFSDSGHLDRVSNDYSFHTDADGDGVIDVAMWENRNSGRLLRGGDCNVLFGKRDLLVSGFGPNGGKEAFVKTGVPFNRAGEVFGISESYYGAALTPAQTWFLAIWNLETGAFVKKLFLPPAPSSGLPNPERLLTPMSVGDLDGDGFDEILVNLLLGPFDPFFAVTVLDGATLDYKWVQYYPTNSSASVWLINSWPTPCQDIDGDGTKDILLVGVDNGFPSSSHLSLCVSGVDGSVIWSDLRPGITPASVIADVNSDGIRDLFYYQSVGVPSDPDGFLRVQSGQDGSVIWETNASDYDPYYSQAFGTSGLAFSREPQPTGDVDGDGIMDIAIFADEWSRPALAGGFLWYLSGANGELLSRDRIHPVPGYPWTDDIVGNVAYHLGDIDNDGWSEFVGLYSGEDLIHPEGIDLIFFGRRTLVCQEEAQEGESVRVGLHMPNGAHKSFRLLLSTSFDPRDSGVHIGTWNTHLVSSPVLSASLNTSLLRGTLDARGMGSLNFRIPQGVGLIGKELFAVAIVEDYTRPSGVLTKSTVGVIKILP